QRPGDHAARARPPARRRCRPRHVALQDRGVTLCEPRAPARGCNVAPPRWRSGFAKNHPHSFPVRPSGILTSGHSRSIPMTKDEVADALDEIGTLLELKGENAFRCNAYHNAARVVQQLDGDLKQLVAEGRLAVIRGIG